QQPHDPRLVPPHGPGTPHAVHHDPAHRPQPADHRRLGRPPAGKRPPRSRRTPAENPAPPPQDPRHARRRAAIGSAAHRTTAVSNTHGTRPGTPGPATAANTSMPANQPRDTKSHRPDA